MGSDRPADVAEVVRFAVEFCKRLNRGDTKYIKAHVRLPLTARRILSEGGGNPVYRKAVLRIASDVVKAGLCENLLGLDPRWPDHPRFPSLKVTGTRKGFQLSTMRGQFQVTFVFEKTQRSFRLVKWSE